MSHITTIKSKVKFTDLPTLKNSLEAFGTVLEGTQAMTLVLTNSIPGAMQAGQPITFLKTAEGWQARADQWGQRRQYEALVGRIGQKYTEKVTMDWIAKNHLSLSTSGIDEQGNVRIKVRSY